jgi:F-type H+-transporting ATPase subunit b
MIKLPFKSYYSVFIFILISQPAFSAEGMSYKSFLGITLDEKFWVLIAFILFIILVSKKATNAANTALDNRSNVIKDKISSAEATLTEAKQLLKDSQQALTDHKNEVNNLINKQKEIAEKNASIYADKISDELKRKNITADREIQYLHTEATSLIKNKIATITLSTVEEIAKNEFKDTKSDTIYENFISNIPKALKS